MAALTELVLRQIELEMVGGMTLLANDASVKAALGGRRLMTAAARARERRGLLAPRVWVVAGEAGRPCNSLGMLRVHIPVAFGARRAGVASHIVRRMAARAKGMRRHFRLGEHDDTGMARTAGDRLLCFQLVRTMATDALRVPAREERRCGNDGLTLTVALLAARERVRGGCVLVGVTGGAHSVRRLTVCGVFGVDLPVTIRARRCYRGLVLVRPMTIEALARRVHHDSRRAALIFQVTARTILGLEGLERSSVPFVLRWGVARECVTRNAVGFRPRT